MDNSKKNEYISNRYNKRYLKFEEYLNFENTKISIPNSKYDIPEEFFENIN